MIQVPLNKVKENIIDLIDKASNGEEVIVTKNENPLVKITSAKKKPKAKFGRAKDKMILLQMILMTLLRNSKSICL